MASAVTSQLNPEARRSLDGWLLAWISAAEQQVKRVDPRAGGTFSAGQVDGMLFAVALAAVDGASAALLGKDHPALVAFRTAVPGLRDMRNMLMHFDEYVQGRGKLQAQGVVEEFHVYFERDGESITLNVCGRSLRVADAFEAACELHRATLNA